MNNAKEFGGNGSARIRVRVKSLKPDLGKRYREARDAIWREPEPRPMPIGWPFDPRGIATSQHWRCPRCHMPAGQCFHVTCSDPRLPWATTAIAIGAYAGFTA